MLRWLFLPQDSTRTRWQQNCKSRHAVREQNNSTSPLFQDSPGLKGGVLVQRCVLPFTAAWWALTSLNNLLASTCEGRRAEGASWSDFGNAQKQLPPSICAGSLPQPPRRLLFTTRLSVTSSELHAARDTRLSNHIVAFELKSTHVQCAVKVKAACVDFPPVGLPPICTAVKLDDFMNTSIHV